MLHDFHPKPSSILTALCIFCIASASQSASAAPNTIWASPSGKGNGSKETPANIDTVRKIISEASDTEKLTIILGEGTYYLNQPIVNENHSAGNKLTTSISWHAESGSKVTLSGGCLLKTNWAPFQKGIFRTQISENIKSIDQLFVDGKLQILARYPNFDAKAQFLNGIANDVDSPERVARWKNPKGGFIHALHNGLWGGFHYEILGKSDDNKLILDGGWQNNRPEYGASSTHRYVENVFEELDSPGEWFFNAESHTLYFYPPADCNLDKATVVVPQLETLVRIEGTKDNPAKNISFEGITFAHTQRTFMKTKESLLRSDWRIYRGGAVVFENAENCSVANCDFDHVGGNAIFVNNYNRNIRISGCYIYNAGASGVCFVGDVAAVRSPLLHYSKTQPLEKIDTQRGPKSDNYPQNCTVEDTLITRIGRIEKQSAGVTIDMASRITVKNCTISDIPRSGINIGGGTWGGHVLEENDVFNTVLETSDHGSFNSWGRDRFWNPNTRTTEEWVKQHSDMPFWDAVEPTTIRHNRFRCDHGWDIDLDDGSSNYLIEDNLCLSGGIKLREGYGRIVRNNITVNNSFHPHVWYAKSGDVVERNIFFRNYAPIGMPSEWGKELNHNFLHNAKLESVLPAEQLQKQSQQDKDSITGNAEFKAPQSGDYRVAEDSPALSVGFKNFAMDNFGVTSARLKARATTPPLPSTQATKPTTTSRSNATISWQGGTFKNIVGMGEQSAAGLLGETGVLVVGVTDQNSVFAKFGVQKGDVIIQWNDIPVSDLNNFRKASSETKNPQVIGVWRNQQKEILTETKQ